MKRKKRTKGFLALFLALVMMLSSATTVFAHEEGEENEGTHDETPYAISIYNEKAPNKNGSLTFTVTNHEDGTVSEAYDLDDTEVTAVEGDTITLYPVANEGYVLSSIGYSKAERVEQAFNIKSVTAQEDGSYTFTMPAYPIYVGAAFYAKDAYYVVSEAGTSNSVANVDPLHLIELGLNQAWVTEDTEEISIDMHLDKRILEFEKESGQKLTFRIEIRMVGDSGFLVYGSKEYTTEELQKLVNEKSTGTETDSKGREYYVLRDVVTPVDADKDFTYTEDGEYEVYCTAMYTLEGWTNAIGAPNYRWGYSGGDRAYILKAGTPLPTPMVYLYNLDPHTYHGALVAEAIDRVEEEMGITIETRYFTSENMGESLGYLAEWPGYESRGEDVSSDKVFKKKIVLYCSLPSMVRDKLGDYIRETGAGATSSKLTTYGAAKSFEELYKNLETESEVFTAALSLSLLTYEAYTNVPEAEYGTHELWEEFKAAYDECKAIINTTTEQEASVYNNARLKLLDVYLRIIGKIQLDVDFEFIIEEYDAKHYIVTVDQSNFPEDLKVDYYWYNASTEDHLIIAKDQLYKVRCSISAADDGRYYGFKEIRLSTPTELDYEINVNTNRITVDFVEYESLANTPEPITYIAEVYEGEELVQTLSNTTGEAVTFKGLKGETEYNVKLYAFNIVGRTSYITETVTTGIAVYENPFTDVMEDDYYYDAVLWAAERGITIGTTKTTFSPDNIISRAETVTMLWRAFGSPMPTIDSCPFTDVATDTYYYNAVLWAYENGITRGTSATTFAPNKTTTRSQNVTFLWRAANEPAANQENTFEDVPDNAYYNDAVSWASENEITIGISETLFAPEDACQRGQFVTFLHRFMTE